MFTEYTLSDKVHCLLGFTVTKFVKCSQKERILPSGLTPCHLSYVSRMSVTVVLSRRKCTSQGPYTETISTTVYFRPRSR